MTECTYTSSLAGIGAELLLGGFFAGWSAPPTPAEHLEIFARSTHLVLALSGTDVVGFATALSDGMFAAYIPLLEVLPAYRGRGVGSELIRRLLAEVGPLYMVDVMCDPDVVPFYEQLGMTAATGAVRRNMNWHQPNLG